MRTPDGASTNGDPPRSATSTGAVMRVAKRAYDHQWRRLRLLVLERDNYRCQMRGEGCTGTATQVDHVVPLDRGGSRLDPTNLQAACAHCNGRDGALIVNAKRSSGYDW